MRGRVAVLTLCVAGLLALLWLRSERDPQLARVTEPGAERGRHEAEAVTAAAQPASTEGAQREALAAGAGAVRALELELVRFPDEAPLVQVAVETVPPAVVPPAGGLATSDEGRLALELPAGTVALEVRVPGFEPGSLALVPGTRAQRLALVPLSGLFGRVLHSDGSPAAGATLALFVEERLLDTSNATRLQPRAYVSRRPRTTATAVANERGGYYLRCATRSGRARVQLRASTSDGKTAVLSIELPREPVALEDIVLGEARRLRVRVIDMAGAPVVGAQVSGSEGIYPGTTDARGEVLLVAPALPALLWVRAEGLLRREERHDGVTVDFGTEVTSYDTRVELVLGPETGAELRVVDAETGLPIGSGSCRVELQRAGEIQAVREVHLGTRGFARLRFHELDKGPEAELPELARVVFRKQGYLEGALELDPRLVNPSEPLVLALEPDPAFARLRGRVVRAGEPVPDFQVGLRAQARSEGAHPNSWQGERAYSDAEGRFALRWRRAPDLVVTVYPHWTRFEEFAFIGPLDAARAAEGEHVLELQPAVRVPAILRGVESEGGYLYYVRVLDEEGGSDVEVGTTINGAPFELAGSGEVRTSLLLPRQRRSRVTIGHRTATSLLTDGSTSAEHDPAHPVLPLVFELSPILARLHGRVVGVAPDELGEVDVGFVGAYDDQARLVRPAADGSFEFPRLLRGKGELFLVRTRDGESSAEVLARLELELTGDREGLVLGPDPASLPEQPTGR